MPKIQRRFKVGSEYKVTGAAKYERRIEFVARIVIDKREYLLFCPRRAASKNES